MGQEGVGEEEEWADERLVLRQWVRASSSAAAAAAASSLLTSAGTETGSGPAEV